MVPILGDKTQVVECISNAIKAVYASTFFNESKTYMRATGNAIEQEKMSVILQEVVGKVFGNRLYPNLSGVARSLNYYPIGDQQTSDGICDLALGLGKYIVDGGKTLHFSPVYPNHLRHMGTVDSAPRDTHTQFYALDLSHFPQEFSVDYGFNILKDSIKDAEVDGTLR